MLKKLLSPSVCAKCRFCCTFRRQSLWETPVFEREKLGDLAMVCPEAKYKNIGSGRITIDLDNNYLTSEPEEETPCYFNRNGCVLDDGLKPFDCKIWPLRVMKKDGKTVIALSPSCPALSEDAGGSLSRLVNDEIGGDILEYAAAHPEIVKEYRPEYKVICER